MRTAGIILYFAGLAFSEALRLPHRWAHLQAHGKWRPGKGVSRGSEAAVLLCLAVGQWVLPGAFAGTHLLNSFNYRVPQPLLWTAMVVFVISLVVRWLGHATLTGFWSGTLALSQGHRLVVTGIYGYLRHPIYTSMILWGLCQPVLLPNVVAGWGGPVAILVLWLVRVPQEEAMMLAAFGDEYRDYAARTGRFFPRLYRKG